MGQKNSKIQGSENKDQADSHKGNSHSDNKNQSSQPRSTETHSIYNSFFLTETEDYESRVQYLLRSPAVFLHAEETGKYTHQIDSFISQTVKALKNQESKIDIDIREPQNYLYILRNLIRRNQEKFNDDISFLLTVPAIRNMAHTALAENHQSFLLKTYTDSLIRAAYFKGNKYAAELLLKIPNVKILVREKNYFRDEIQAGALDLKALTNDITSAEITDAEVDLNEMVHAVKLIETLLILGAPSNIGLFSDAQNSSSQSEINLSNTTENPESSI